MFETFLARAGERARVEANRAVLRFINGVDWLVRDPKTVVGRTPHDVVYRKDKLEVRRYRHRAAAVRPRYPVPVLLVPPLMVKPFIFDLFPSRSLVSFLLEQGFRVYLVDFGEPDRADAYVTLDDYVLDWIPAACAAVKRDAASRELSMLGYCMGGLFALSHVAANRDDSVRAIVSIGAPVDSHKMGLFAWVVKNAGGQLDGFARRLGNVPGGLSSTVFRLLTPMKNVTRYGDLFMNLWDREYMNGFDAMNTWVNEFIDYPQGAFLQFFNDFMRHNKLAKGNLTFRGRVADLRRMRAALLAIAGRTDQIAPVAAVQAVLDKVGSTDKTFLLAPGGHMGVFAGSTAPEHVWRPAAEWLAARSQASVAATRPASVAARPPQRRAAASRRPTPRRRAPGPPGQPGLSA
jgi:polyhydroxyalkanoate synthase